MAENGQSVPISTQTFQAAHLLQIDLSYLQRCIAFLIRSSEDHSSSLQALEGREASLSARTETLEIHVKSLEDLRARDDLRLQKLETTVESERHRLREVTAQLEALASRASQGLLEVNEKLDAHVGRIGAELTRVEEQQVQSFDVLKEETLSLGAKMKEMEEEREREKEEAEIRLASMKEIFEAQISSLEQQLRLTSERAAKAERSSEEAAAGVQLAREAAAQAAAQAAAVAEQVEEANKLSYVHQIEREKIMSRLDAASSLTEATAVGLSSHGHDDWAGNLQQAMASMVSAWQISEQRLTALQDKVEGIDMMVKVQSIGEDEEKELGREQEQEDMELLNEGKEERIEFDNQEETRRIEKSLPGKTGAVFRQIIEAHGSLTKRKADKAEFDTLCHKVQELDLLLKQWKRSERAASQRTIGIPGESMIPMQEEEMAKIATGLAETTSAVSRLATRMEEMEQGVKDGRHERSLDDLPRAEQAQSDHYNDFLLLLNAKAGQEEMKSVKAELDQIRKHLFGFALSGTSIQHDTTSKLLADASTSMSSHDVAEQTQPEKEEKEDENKTEEEQRNRANHVLCHEAIDALATRIAQLEQRRWTRSTLRVSTSSSSSALHLGPAQDDLKRYEVEKRPKTSATDFRSKLPPPRACLLLRVLSTVLA